MNTCRTLQLEMSHKRFTIPLFSASEQIHCALVVCHELWMSECSRCTQCVLKMELVLLLGGCAVVCLIQQDSGNPCSHPLHWLGSSAQNIQAAPCQHAHWSHRHVNLLDRQGSFEMSRPICPGRAARYPAVASWHAVRGSPSRFNMLSWPSKSALNPDSHNFVRTGKQWR